VCPERGRRIKVLISMEGVLAGSLRHLQYLLRFADPRKFDLQLAVSAERAPHVREDFQRWRDAGWRVHEIPMRREIGPVADLRAFAALSALCQRERFDVVHTHCAKAGFLGRLAARRAGARTVHTPHVFSFTHVGGDAARAVFLALERRAARWTDRFILLSNYQLNVLLDSGLAEPQRAVVVPNGIVPEEFAGPERAQARKTLGLARDVRIALFVGRFRLQKGLDILLGAADALRPHLPGLCVVVVGEGPLESWLRTQIRARGLSGVVDLRGPSERIETYYAACDLVVMPSRAEGMPYVMLEAKAAARPVVAALVSGMEEFVEHGVDGFLVPPENPEALAATLREALGQPGLLAQMGERARAGWRRAWNAPHAVASICAVYEELASTSARRLGESSVGEQPG